MNSRMTQVRGSTTVAILALSFVTCAVGISGCRENAPAPPASVALPATIDTLALAVPIRIDDSNAPPGLLADIHDALVVDDSLVLIRDPSDRIVRVFNREGHWVRNIGGAGSGPGEFRDVSGLFPGADNTVVVYDRARRRLISFAYDGSLRGEQNVETQLGRAVVGVTKAGIVAIDNYSSTPQSPKPVDIELISVGGTEVRVHSLPPRTVTSTTFRMQGVPQSLQTSEIFGRVPIVAADQAMIVVADHRSGIVHLYSAEGRPVRKIDMALRPKAVLPHEVEDYRRMFLNGFPGASDELRQFLNDVPVATHHPLFDDVQIGETGVWLLLSEHSQRHAGCWVNVAPRGKEGSWETVCGLSDVLAFGSTQIVAVKRDDDDVAVASIYTFAHASGGASNNPRKAR